MVKRLIAVVMLVTVCAASQAVSAAAQGEIRIEQAQVEMPGIVAYFYAPDGSSFENASASLGRESLQVMEIRSVRPGDPVQYYFLVDCSTSTRAAQMNAVKAALAEFAETLQEGESFTLITFGVGVDVVLDGETDEAAISAAVDALKPDQKGTVFFDALAKAIELAERGGQARKVAFVFSDSVDVNTGGYTKEEIDKLLMRTSIPFYALGFDTGDKAGLDSFGSIARQSGGTISVVSAQTLPQVFAQTVDSVRGASVVTLRAKNNLVTAAEQELVLSVSGMQAARTIPTSRHVPDLENPGITSVSQATDVSIVIAFSEPVQFAANPESYAIKNASGDLVGIRAIAYDEDAAEATVTFSDAAFVGEITISCPGVRDVSMEQNAVKESVSMLFAGVTAPPVPTPTPVVVQVPVEGSGSAAGEGVPVAAWIFVALAAAGIITAVVVATTRKRARVVASDGTVLAPGKVHVEQLVSSEPEVQVHFIAAELPKIRLDVTSALGDGRSLTLPINKSLFVGRSEICDVYFDDPDLSRQHFVIEENDGMYTLTNLSETMGTMLNGVPVAKTRPLSDGDRIEAGNERFVFRREQGQ